MTTTTTHRAYQAQLVSGTAHTVHNFEQPLSVGQSGQFMPNDPRTWTVEWVGTSFVQVSK